MNDNVINFGSYVKNSDGTPNEIPSMPEQVENICKFLEDHKDNVHSILACVLVREGDDLASNILTTKISAGDLALSIRLADASFLEKIFMARHG